MKGKSTIRKILFISVWVLIGAGMVTLLAAAMRRQHNDRCKDFEVVIAGKQDVIFADLSEVTGMLKKAAKGDVKGQLIASLNLRNMEALLEKNAWIRTAVLYIDNKNVLHVKVQEREPVARVFTNSGSSFYIDSTGARLPLSDKLTARLTVFTGFPDRSKLTAKDSVLLNDVRTTALFIWNDPFWKAQVAQLDITDDGKFEMIPLVGDHVVRLGNGEDIAAKFHRLYVFYSTVLNQAGFEKYKVIDVQYKGQVVGVKDRAKAAVDSVQVRRNIEQMLQQAARQDDENAKLTTDAPAVQTPAVTIAAPDADNDPKPVKQDGPKKPAARTTANPPKPAGGQHRVPRAVMPKRNG